MMTLIYLFFNCTLIEILSIASFSTKMAWLDESVRLILGRLSFLLELEGSLNLSYFCHVSAMLFVPIDHHLSNPVANYNI